MPFVTRKSLLGLAVLAVAAVLAAAAFVWSGVYDVGADDAHTRPVTALLQAVRERSIEVRSRDLAVPDLASEARIVQGAGNYDAMCTGCHLQPGVDGTELSRGLYPAPPDLTKERVDAAAAFWSIKHGIKASGMPAWGRSMEDAYIWNMVAFLQKLPELDPAQYRAMVERSGGHSHGGGETEGHARAGETAGDHPHPEGTADHHASEGVPPAQGAKTHVHADGKTHVHAAAGTQPAGAARTSPAKTTPEPANREQAETSPSEEAHEHTDHEH